MGFVNKETVKEDRLVLEYGMSLEFNAIIDKHLDTQRMLHEEHIPLDKWFSVGHRWICWFLEHQMKEFTYKYPATWWDHFKERFFNKRLLSLFPVNYHIDTIRVSEVFPFNEIEFPKEIGDKVVVATMRSLHPASAKDWETE